MRVSVGCSQAARKHAACRPAFAGASCERLLKAPVRTATLVSRAVAEDIPEVSESDTGAAPAPQVSTKKLPKSAPPFRLAS